MPLATVWWSWKTFLKYVGPGFIIAIAYLDPGNLEADLQAGSLTKYQLNWVLIVTTIVGLMFQEAAARIGVVTGRHLAQLCREAYSPNVSYVLWITTEISLIGCDVQGVISTAVALRILFKWPYWLGCIASLCDVVTFFCIDYFHFHKLEFIFIGLVAIMSICFFWNFSLNLPSPVDLLYGSVVPLLPWHGMEAATGIVGSVISPQNYYIHSAVVIRPNFDRSNQFEIQEANKYIFVESVLALAVAYVLNFAVMSCFAELFYSKNCATGSPTSACLAKDHALPSQQAHVAMFEKHSSGMSHSANCTVNDMHGVCSHIGLSEAPIALKGAVGRNASLIWALGLLASAQSSTFTVTYAGQYVNEGFNGRKLPVYLRVFIIRIFSLLFALHAALMMESHPHALDTAAQWGNVTASMTVPIVATAMLNIASSKQYMGDHSLSVCSRWIIGTMILLILVSNIGLVWYYIITADVFPQFACILLLVGITCLYLFANVLVSDLAIAQWLLTKYYQQKCFQKHNTSNYAQVRYHLENEDGEAIMSTIEMVETGSESAAEVGTE